ncbi:EAL domain-containing protein [Leptospira sp. GIMC2001]|uniref:EAL domain-containing protein n=1 Tax=Leptospira sp. GIMC2001 TaxID=1513297 RepID=UPI0023499E2C|nr:EAL domain-containing protein [Leptospira sp. GIMC2001]WCL47547.1 EAL domain-containing protein [Leptospira sp. GIMC2001]
MKRYLPFLQPILSIEDQSIFGHEVLAREETDKGFILPDIFLRELSGKSEEFLRIETEVLSRAFAKLKTTESGHLFINMSPDELLRQLEDSKGDDLPLAKLTKDAGISNERIFIEITEVATLRDPEAIGTAVEYFRELGFRIAMDDVGSESSNLERIAIIQPQIIKVDLLLLKRSMHDRNFHSVLEYLSHIASGLGSDLLFEGIENSEELRRALDFGARFVQGYLLGMPNKEFASPKIEADTLKIQLDAFHEFKRNRIMEEIRFEDEIRNLISRKEPTVKNIGDIVHIDAHSLFQLSPFIRRVYATDWEGTQITPYYERSGENGFTQNTVPLSKNWSYMPFFYKHVKKSFHNPKTWNASEPYFDKVLRKNILVFSKVTQDHISLFIDVQLPDPAV